jgi:glycosyltransferase involved in cell wall biosynthesis
MRIAVSITTHNRYEIFKVSYENIKKLLPKGALLVVIDDGSIVPVPEATFRFEKSKGIAAAKNKAFELTQGYDYHFAFDDDVYPKVKDWHLPYINSGENHLCFSFTKFSNGSPNGRKKIGQNGNLSIYQEPCGCMNFYTKACFDAVGGMDPEFGKWSYEHVGHSMRIHNAGLTKYPFMDISNSLDLFYSYDWDQTTKRSVDVKLRNSLAFKNRAKYQKEIKSKKYISFMEPVNQILTCFFTGINDPQRTEQWTADLTLIDDLIDSLNGLGLVIIHDCFDVTEYRGAKLIRVEPGGNPYTKRWIEYKKYIENNEIENVFCVDATDVQVLKNPFDEISKNRIYIGDEKSTIHNDWLRRHHNKPIFARFFMSFRRKVLLNAGIVGGNRNILLRFLKDLTELIGNNDVGLTDMAAVNYIAYTKYQMELSHGEQVNTVFKSYQPNDISWFKHK